MVKRSSIWRIQPSPLNVNQHLIMKLHPQIVAIALGIWSKSTATKRLICAHIHPSYIAANSPKLECGSSWPDCTCTSLSSYWRIVTLLVASSELLQYNSMIFFDETLVDWRMSIVGASSSPRCYVLRGIPMNQHKEAARLFFVWCAYIFSSSMHSNLLPCEQEG